MKLSGFYKLNVKKEIVWKALNDPDILQKCIPGCDSFNKESDISFNVTATNQIGPMNATFSGTVNLSNIKENESYSIHYRLIAYDRLISGMELDSRFVYILSCRFLRYYAYM